MEAVVGFTSVCVCEGRWSKDELKVSNSPVMERGVNSGISRCLLANLAMRRKTKTDNSAPPSSIESPGAPITFAMRFTAVRMTKMAAPKVAIAARRGARGSWTTRWLSWRMS